MVLLNIVSICKTIPNPNFPEMFIKNLWLTESEGFCLSVFNKIPKRKRQQQQQKKLSAGTKGS